MNTELDFLDDFANSYAPSAIDGLSSELIIAIVAKMGGEEAFLDVYEDVFYYGAEGRVDCFNDEDECLAFYTEHKTHILEYLEAHCDEMGIKDSVSLMEGLLRDASPSSDLPSCFEIKAMLELDPKKPAPKRRIGGVLFYRQLLLHIVELISDEYLQYESL